MSRPNRSKNFFVTRKQGNAIAVTNGTIATWLTETLKLASIKASGWFDPEGFGVMGGIQGGINKDHLGGRGTGLTRLPHIAITSNAYLRAVAQRIAEQISGSIQANVVGQLDVDIDPEPD